MPKLVYVAQRSQLAERLREAIRMRGVTQAEVAREFGVKPPTVSSDWLKHGRIAKRHFPHLVRYFKLPYEWWLGELQPAAALASQDISQIRRENFALFLREKYRAKRPAAVRDLKLSGVTELAAFERGAAPIDDDLAARIESAAGKPPGWLDVPDAGRGQPAIDQRIAALPQPLRAYLLGELELCETVAPRMPADFMTAPTAQNVRAFQDYLRSLLEQPQRRRTG